MEFHTSLKKLQIILKSVFLELPDQIGFQLWENLTKGTLNVKTLKNTAKEFQKN